jgi:hypothetical protein
VTVKRRASERNGRNARSGRLLARLGAAVRTRRLTQAAPSPESERAPPAPPTEWNLWELERRSRERAGPSPQNEESTALFVYLRPFANADGVLPKEFDEFVRESFPDLIPTA